MDISQWIGQNLPAIVIGAVGILVAWANNRNNAQKLINERFAIESKKSDDLAKRLDAAEATAAAQAITFAAERGSLTQQIATLEKERAKAEGNAAENRDRIIALETELKILKTEQTALKGQIETVRSERDALRVQYEQRSAELERLSRDFEQLKRIIVTLRHQIEAKDAELKQLQERLGDTGQLKAIENGTDEHANADPANVKGDGG